MGSEGLVAGQVKYRPLLFFNPVLMQWLPSGPFVKRKFKAVADCNSVRECCFWNRRSAGRCCFYEKHRWSKHPLVLAWFGVERLLHSSGNCGKRAHRTGGLHTESDLIRAFFHEGFCGDAISATACQDTAITSQGPLLGCVLKEATKPTCSRSP